MIYLLSFFIFTQLLQYFISLNCFCFLFIFSLLLLNDPKKLENTVTKFFFLNFNNECVLFYSVGFCIHFYIIPHVTVALFFVFFFLFTENAFCLFVFFCLQNFLTKKHKFWQKHGEWLECWAKPKENEMIQNQKWPLTG